MQIKDIMTKEVITVNLETKVEEVARILTENRFHGVPVVDDGKVVGIIVEDDFFSKSPAVVHLPSYINFLKKTPVVEKMSESEKEKINQLLNIKAKDIMTPNCLCLSPWMEVGEILNVFKDTQLNTFPVVDEGKKLAGIVTLADVLSLIKTII